MIELLTVIAIIGILAAIIIPSVAAVQKNARKAVDASNLRQIGAAAISFANENRDRLPSHIQASSGADFATPRPANPPTEAANATPKLFAAALAVSGALTDASFWIALGDQTSSTAGQQASTIINVDKTGLNTDFDALVLAYGVTSGLSLTAYPASTPLAYARGILTSTDGKWSKTSGIYEDEGGHIVFLGGNVRSLKTLGSNNTSGELIGGNGASTNRIVATVLPTRLQVRFYEEDINGVATGVGPVANN